MVISTEAPSVGWSYLIASSRPKSILSFRQAELCLCLERDVGGKKLGKSQNSSGGMVLDAARET
jgi:hypothetical protein